MTPYKKFVPVALAILLLMALGKSCSPDRATWYGQSHRGKLMANGKPFNPDALTAASWDYPLGTKLRIIHDKKSVVVEVTDRGGAKKFFQIGRTIDLSRAAFSQLAPTQEGSISVRIVRVD